MCSGEAAGRGDTAPDVVLAWNERVLAIAEAEDGFLTLKGVRTAAMMHIAMHDALNSISPPVRSVRLRHPARRRRPGRGRRAGGLRSRRRAVSGSGGRATGGTRPLARRRFPTTRRGPRESRLGTRGSGGNPGAPQGRRLGQGRPSTAGTRWRPASTRSSTSTAARRRASSSAPARPNVRPFLMRKPDQFRSPPPPAITSDAYTAAFDEVKRVGRHESRVRTADQSHLAMWWKEFVEASHNRLARQLVSNPASTCGKRRVSLRCST